MGSLQTARLKAELNATKSSLVLEKAKIVSMKDEATALKAELNATSSATKSSLSVEKATITSLNDEANALKAERNATKSRLSLEKAKIVKDEAKALKAELNARSSATNSNITNTADTSNATPGLNMLMNTHDRIMERMQCTALPSLPREMRPFFKYTECINRAEYLPIS